MYIASFIVVSLNQSLLSSHHLTYCFRHTEIMYNVCTVCLVILEKEGLLQVGKFSKLGLKVE